MGEETKRVIISPKFPDATKEDYAKVQGGMPEVTIEGKTATIIHNYPGGDNMIVTGLYKPESVTLMVKDVGYREFNAAFLKQFHGDPCEKMSRSMGGHGYERDKKI